MSKKAVTKKPTKSALTKKAKLAKTDVCPRVNQNRRRPLD
jgi:hypothetical protein